MSYETVIEKVRSVPEERLSDVENVDNVNNLTAETIYLAEKGKELHGPFVTIDELRKSLNA